jgi:hypothetical protein
MCKVGRVREKAANLHSHHSCSFFAMLEYIRLAFKLKQRTKFPSMLLPDCLNSLITNSTFVPAASRRFIGTLTKPRSLDSSVDIATRKQAE